MAVLTVERLDGFLSLLCLKSQSLKLVTYVLIPYAGRCGTETFGK